MGGSPASPPDRCAATRCTAVYTLFVYVQLVQLPLVAAVVVHLEAAAKVCVVKACWSTATSGERIKTAVILGVPILITAPVCWSVLRVTRPFEPPAPPTG